MNAHVDVGVWEKTGNMMTNRHETLGGIIDFAPAAKSWFVIFHGDRVSQEGFESRDLAVLAFTDARILDAVDGAHPAGMLGDDSFNLELATRLDDVARCLMGLRPDLEPASLDDWLANNMDVLSDGEKRAALAVIETY